MKYLNKIVPVCYILSSPFCSVLLFRYVHTLLVYTEYTVLGNMSAGLKIMMRDEIIMEKNEFLVFPSDPFSMD
jgi:hypothetical protein